MSSTARTSVPGYGSEAEAMAACCAEGKRKALALPNRGPIRYTPDGQVHPEILEAYWEYGFYVFENVLRAEELEDIERDLFEILDRLPVRRGSPVDARPPSAPTARRLPSSGRSPWEIRSVAPISRTAAIRSG